ncbi:IPT/TIG domain-containing protein [Pontibacter russatus]|uniref:IPT/TIG domain-containing protein n=1 Tax=Pontibacter russatus TaxID=2694929 RepID=UPI00137A4C57|nr:IPT/TIG domain-containing protein [Pontibacter russatus]
MKNVYNVRLFTLVFLFLFAGFLTACEDDEDSEPNGGMVQLLSFGPSGVQHGEEIKFIGHNLNKVEAVELPGVSVPKSAFKSHTSDMIVLVVPQEAGEGLVTLKTTDGDVVSKTVLSFEVPVTIESVMEEARPGANITATGNYMNWVTGVVFDSDTVSEFVSQTMNELVLQVPVNAKTGRLVFLTGGTEPQAIVTETDLVVTLPSIANLAPNPVERGSNLTITGENLDLTMGVLFNGITEPITEFVSVSPAELVVVVPAEAGKGVVTLVAHSGVQVESETSLQFIGDLPPLAALPYFLYNDARGTGWENWGWGGATNWESTEKVRQGDFAARKTYDGSYDAIRWHIGTAVSTADYTHLVFSVYGGPGTDGKIVNIVIDEGYNPPAGTFNVVEGEWTTYTIPLSDLGSPASIGDIMFQSAGWAGVVHYDHVGFK